MDKLTRENAVEDKYWANNLDEAIEYLVKCRQEGKNVWIEFNRQRLYSNDATVDTIYMQMFGKTKQEFEQAHAAARDRVGKKLEELGKEIAEKKPEWIEKGESLIYPAKSKDWKKFIDIMSQSIDNVGEMDFALDIMGQLEDGKSFEEIKQYIQNGSSEISITMLENMALKFSKRGPDFFEFMREGKGEDGQSQELDENTKKLIQEIRKQNEDFEIEQAIKTRGPEWMKRAERLVYPEKMAEWKRCIDTRANYGEELDMALGAMELLDQGASFEDAEKYIEDASTSLSGVKIAENLVLNFSRKGPDFFESIRPGEYQDLIAKLRKENADFEKKLRTTGNQIDNSEQSQSEEQGESELKALLEEKKKLIQELADIEQELEKVEEQTHDKEDKSIGMGE